MPRRILGRYEEIEVVGSGGQGSVTKSLDHDLGIHVALKRRLITSRDDPQRFVDEARLLRSLPAHPAIPVFREDFFIGDHYFMVMDWVDGATVTDSATHRVLEFGEVVAVASDVAAAIDHLHSQHPPIIHRDVKPSNVLITGNSHACLVDFGIAQETSGRVEAAGSAYYRAPEIRAGEKPNRASDIYGLAALTYFMFSSRQPSLGVAPEFVVRLSESQRANIRQALALGLSLDPAQRPASGDDFLALLLPCPSCGERFETRWSYCAHCGRSLN